MMNYEQFKKTVKENFIYYMPDKFKDMEPERLQVGKVNHTLDAISVKGDNTSVFPTIYINDMYKDYQNGADLETILIAACDAIARAYDEALDINVKDILTNASDLSVISQRGDILAPLFFCLKVFENGFHVKY